jgi:hypothetical protein
MNTRLNTIILCFSLLFILNIPFNTYAATPSSSPEYVPSNDEERKAIIAYLNEEIFNLQRALADENDSTHISLLTIQITAAQQVLNRLANSQRD